MRYVYQQIAGPAIVNTIRTAVTEPIATNEPRVEVFVNAATYDSILATLAASGAGDIPSDIAAVFQHRGPFTIICDPTVL
jgi:hypothetical protein